MSRYGIQLHGYHNIIIYVVIILNILTADHSYRGKSKLSAMKTSGIIIGFIIGAILLLTSIGLGVYVGLNAHNSQCASASASSSIEKLIAKNSTVILLNTTDDYAAGQQACYEPNITITAKFPMNIYLLPCQSVRYFNYTYVRNSLEYPNQSNPLPSGFDENYHNYLVKGHISVTVNVSLTEINPAMPAEYIYFCLYMDYTQFQNFISKSTTSYWKNYDGNQCNRQQLGDDENAMILKDTLNFTQPEYVFVGFGSTVDILGTFKFTVNVSGQKLLDPGQTPSEDSITESCILGDQQHTCQLALNLENISEALCIIGSRPVDHISQEPFKRLTVKWAPKFNKPDKTIKIAISVVAALAGISGIVLLSLCSYFCYKKCTSKLDCSSKPIQEQNTDSS